MQKISKTNIIYRIIDANINRAKEGLRVCEEVTRFILDNRQLTAEFKNIRHKIEHALKSLPSRKDLLQERKSLSDIGRNIYANELKRTSAADIFFANMQRAKESVRVLEEFSKLFHIKAAVEFKNIRYAIYELEKKTILKIK